MKPNEKAIAGHDGSNTNLTERLTMNHNTTNQQKFQSDSSQSRANLLEQSKLSRLPERKAFVCDECARPLRLYGENFIETYTNGKVNILRCLCDLHADEMEVGK
jgi:hypothetical protein